LIAAHIFSPGASFLGHLSGIFAGLVIQHFLLPILLQRPVVPTRAPYDGNVDEGARAAGRTYGYGTVGNRTPTTQQPPPRMETANAPTGSSRRAAPPPPQFDDIDATSNQPSAPLRPSSGARRPAPPPPSGEHQAYVDPPVVADTLSADELRRRRLARFGT